MTGTNGDDTFTGTGQDQYVEQLRSQCIEAGLNVEWSPDVEQMQYLLWEAAELNGYGMAALRERARRMGVQVADPTQMTQQFNPWAASGQHLTNEEASACRRACTGKDVRSPPPEYAQKLLQDRNDIVGRLKVMLTWQAMSLQQLQVQCRLRQIPTVEDENYWAVRGKGSEKSDLISRLQQDVFPGAKGPVAEKGWTPSYTQRVWIEPPETPAVEPPQNEVVQEEPVAPQVAYPAVHKRQGLCVAPPKPVHAAPQPFPRQLEPESAGKMAAVAAMDNGGTLYDDALVAIACLLEIGE